MCRYLSSPIAANLAHNQRPGRHHSLKQSRPRFLPTNVSKKTDPEPCITIHHRLLAFAQAVVNHSARRPAITKFFSPGFLTTGAKSADHPNQTRECRSPYGRVAGRAGRGDDPGEREARQ